MYRLKKYITSEEEIWRQNWTNWLSIRFINRLFFLAHLQQVIAFHLDPVSLVLYFHSRVYCRRKSVSELKIPVLVIINSIWDVEGIILLISIGRSSQGAQHPWNIWNNPQEPPAQTWNCRYCNVPGENLGIPSCFCCQGFQLRDLDQNLQFQQPRWKLHIRISGSIPE